eukprot:212901-Pyramimonas_sp.AAC.1
MVSEHAMLVRIGRRGAELLERVDKDGGAATVRVDRLQQAAPDRQHGRAAANPTVLCVAQNGLSQIGVLLIEDVTLAETPARDRPLAEKRHEL